MASETAIATLIIGIALLYWLNGLNLNEKYQELKLLFYTISLWITVIATNVGIIFADDNGLTKVSTNLHQLYIVTSAIAYFVTVYFVIHFVMWLIRWMIDWRKGKKDEDTGNDD